MGVQAGRAAIPSQVGSMAAVASSVQPAPVLITAVAEAESATPKINFGAKSASELSSQTAAGQQGQYAKGTNYANNQTTYVHKYGNALQEQTAQTSIIPQNNPAIDVAVPPNAALPAILVSTPPISTMTVGAGSGRIIGLFSAVQPGPLPDAMAGTFAGGRYRVVELLEDTILYRSGTAAAPLGQYFSGEPPTSVLLTCIDNAVLPVWPDGGASPLDTAFAIKIPAGTQVYIGEVGSQGGMFVGGKQQIVVVKPWTIPGVQVIESKPLP